ncbi:MAG: DUF3788 family protein [Anaeromyxobacter sp.]
MTAQDFTDPARPPVEDGLLAALGPSAAAWTALFSALREAHPELHERWRFYADGKRWLLNVSRRSKTVCWVAAERGRFRVTFYFPVRLTASLLASELSARCRAGIGESASVGKLRPVSVAFGPRRGVRDVLRLVELKQTLR